MSRLSFVAVVAVISTAACSKPPAPVAAAPIPTVNVTLSDYAIAVPASMPAGFTTFHTNNSSQQLHEAALVRLDSGKTIADFQAAMTKQAPPPPWVVFLGGPVEVSDITIELVPGNYVLYCMVPGADGVPHLMKGMAMAFVVTPAAGATPAAPVADIDVALHDYQWDFSTPLTTGHHLLKVTTAPGQPHEMVLIKVAAGKTSKDLLDWFAKAPAGAPPIEWAHGAAALQAGQVNYLSVDVTPGLYMLMCYLPDASDGKDHISHGMVKELTIQ